MKIASRYFRFTCIACFFINSIFCLSKEDDAPEISIQSQHIPSVCDSKTRDGDILISHYQGFVIIDDQTRFIDSSYERGITFNFRLGSERVMQGFNQGFNNMCLGEKRQILIPPELAYGEGGIPHTIPPNSNLIFDIELVEINPHETETYFID